MRCFGYKCMTWQGLWLHSWPVTNLFLMRAHSRDLTFFSFPYTKIKEILEYEGFQQKGSWVLPVQRSAETWRPVRKMLTAGASSEGSMPAWHLTFFSNQTLQLQLTVDKNQESILTRCLTSDYPSKTTQLFLTFSHRKARTKAIREKQNHFLFFPFFFFKHWITE